MLRHESFVGTNVLKERSDSYSLRSSYLADYFHPEGGGDAFLRNVGSNKIHKAPHLSFFSCNLSPTSWPTIPHAARLGAIPVAAWRVHFKITPSLCWTRVISYVWNNSLLEILSLNFINQSVDTILIQTFWSSRTHLEHEFRPTCTIFMRWSEVIIRSTIFSTFQMTFKSWHESWKCIRNSCRFVT
jgi:hypothetical protein